VPRRTRLIRALNVFTNVLNSFAQQYVYYIIRSVEDTFMIDGRRYEIFLDKHQHNGMIFTKTGDTVNFGNYPHRDSRTGDDDVTACSDK
jgi:hypothetical protein